MTECRIKMWKKKTGTGTAIKMCTLPPTSEAGTENIKRVHYQTFHCKEWQSGKTSPLEAMDNGGESDGSILKPGTVPPGTKLAPNEILEMVCCGCEVSHCQEDNRKCENIGCTIFCACEARALCLNPLTKNNQVTLEHNLENVMTIRMIKMNRMTMRVVIIIVIMLILVTWIICEECLPIII